MRTKYDQLTLVRWCTWMGLAIMMLVFCAGCTQPQTQNKPTQIPEQQITLTPNLDVTPTSTTNVATAEPSACDNLPQGVYQITQETVAWSMWSETDSHLYYRLKDSDEYLQFNLEDKSTVTVSKEQLPLDAHPISRLIPDEVQEHLQSISPSGNIAIFAEKEYLGPTAIPNSEGESWVGTDIQYNFFVLGEENPTPTYLGSIDGSVDSFQWIPSEKEMLIHTNARDSGTASLWLADLDNHILEPVFIVEEGKSPPWFEALSPSGDLILYEQTSNIYIYNRATGGTKELALPEISGIAYYWFLSEQELLIVDDFEEPLDFKMAHYDLQTEQLHPISEQNLQIYSVELSPEHNYLSVRWSRTQALYVFSLNSDCY